MPKTAAPSRRQRRARARLSPAELAHRQLADGEIRPVDLAKRYEKVARVEVGSWGDDVWLGKDRDYAAEAKRRAAGEHDPRVYTGSGDAKVRCDCCGRDTPPIAVHPYRGGVRCDDCRIVANSAFYERVAGSSHAKLIGGGD